MIKFLFSPKGRISRVAFLLGMLFLIIYVTLMLLGFYMFYFDAPQLLGGFNPSKFLVSWMDWIKVAPRLIAIMASVVFVYLYLYLPIISTTKRLHDLNCSGWSQMIPYLPLMVSVIGLKLNIVEVYPNFFSMILMGYYILSFIALIYGIYLFIKLSLKLGHKEDNQYGKALN